MLRIQDWFNDQPKSDPRKVRASFDVQPDRTILVEVNDCRICAIVKSDNAGIKLRR